jgi:hypothetical protein
MRRLACLALLASVGCSRHTGVVITVDAPGIVADQLRLTAAYDDGNQTRTLQDGTAGTLLFPTDLFAEFDPRPVAVTFTVEALAAGATIASATTSPLQIVPGQIARDEVELVAVAATAPTGPAPDGGGPPRIDYPSVVLADAPLAYYRLDETSGTIAHDSSGHRLDGTYGAGVTHGAPGLIVGDGDAAASFSGGAWTHDGIVEVPPALMLEPSQSVSVELWMRQPVLNPDATILVDYGDPGPSVMQDPAYGLLIYKSAFNVFLWTDVAEGGGPSFGPATQPTTNQVYHVVETFDGQSVRVFVDGVLSATMQVSGTLAFANQRGGLGIGGTTVGGAADVVFGGTLDEVAIYGFALSPAQVLKHFMAGTTK